MRQRRWLELLKDYDTNIQYHPGKANVVADALSRKSGMIACFDSIILRDLERLDVELLYRLCVPNDQALREKVMTEAHSSPFTIPSPVQPKVKIEHQRLVVCYKEAAGDFLLEMKSLDCMVHRLLFVSTEIRIYCPRFFGKDYRNLWGTRLKFSTKTFHPQTDGQLERTIQTLEDMLRACALEWTGSWDEYLCLVEFAYNNSWHASIKAAPFELLYGIKCQHPICWMKVSVGYRVFLKVSPYKGVKTFGIKASSVLDHLVRLKILNDWRGRIVLALPPAVIALHRCPFIYLFEGINDYHPLHVASYLFDQIQPDMSLSEEPESILDGKREFESRGSDLIPGCFTFDYCFASGIRSRYSYLSVKVTNMPRAIVGDIPLTKSYIPKVSETPDISPTIANFYKPIENRCIHKGRVADQLYYTSHHIDRCFSNIEGPYYTDLPTPDEIHQFLRFKRVDSNRTIKNKFVTLTPNQVLTKEVREDLKRWEELIYAKATPKSHLPYGMFLTRLFRYVTEHYPHLDNDIYNFVYRVMRPLALKQTRRPRCDRGIPKARHFVSSSSTHHFGSSSHQEDDDNDEGTSRASTPSPNSYLNSLSHLTHQTYNIPTSSEQTDRLLFERQTTLLNQTQQIHEEVRGGFKSFGKALKGVFGKKKK
ncbi:ribosomal protein L7Ae/L30e/S12e/Gadd45 [Tanacetum coccineum]|uniref:Ribosomal protein L7Ae/L30e/S12e/Gadd45 n=1 Tax=Tanacetum coccineum TaxID=301880 RepID=A0ABQ5F156_9ASTR